MMPEDKNAPRPGGGGDEVYYVENVDGDDFTFYLTAEGNEHLLREEVSDQGGQVRSRGGKFSYARPLTVVRCSPLFKKSDVKDARKFLARLRQAAADPQAAYLYGYHNDARIWHRWLNRMIVWWHSLRLRYAPGWTSSFEIYELLERVRVCKDEGERGARCGELKGRIGELASWQEFHLMVNQLVDSLKPVSVESD